MLLLKSVLMALVMTGVTFAGPVSSTKKSSSLSSTKYSSTSTKVTVKTSSSPVPSTKKSSSIIPTTTKKSSSSSSSSIKTSTIPTSTKKSSSSIASTTSKKPPIISVSLSVGLPSISLPSISLPSIYLPSSSSSASSSSFSSSSSSAPPAGPTCTSGPDVANFDDRTDFPLNGPGVAVGIYRQIQYNGFNGNAIGSDQGNGQINPNTPPNFIDFYSGSPNDNGGLVTMSVLYTGGPSPTPLSFDLTSFNAGCAATFSFEDFSQSPDPYSGFSTCAITATCRGADGATIATQVFDYQGNLAVLEQSMRQFSPTGFVSCAEVAFSSNTQDFSSANIDTIGYSITCPA